MKVGIVGRQRSGKTTLFQALSKGMAQVSHSKEPVHTVVTVPDPRFDYFVKLYNPKKVSPAAIDFIDDVVKIGEDRGKEFSDEAMGELRQTDALAYVIGAFESDPDPSYVLQEALDFIEEMSFRDLVVIESRLERIKKQMQSPQASSSLKVEQLALLRIKEGLESGKRFSEIALEETELKSLSGFQFLTSKPVVVAVNVSEDALPNADEKLADSILELRNMGIPAFCLSAELEKEISMLEEEEQADFLGDLGLTEPVAGRLIREIYSGCNLMTFFTIGEKEVHAWTLEKGSTALEAADTIHSDLARGFIRAEVISYEDVREHGGYDEAKAAGKMKLVGKEHIIQDGDCLFIRFKV